MYDDTTSTGSIDAISSGESADGSLPCSSPDGRPIDLSGPALAHANPTPAPAKARATPTRETSGRNCSGSFESADLSQSLANRLRARFDTVGSMEFQQTWKARVTPSGRSYWEHTARARPISDSESFGWPTPTKTDSRRHPSDDFQTDNITLNHAAVLAGWNSPTATDDQGHGFRTDGRAKLPGQAKLAGWPTPCVGDSDRGRDLERRDMEGPNSHLTTIASFAGWTTPCSTDGKRGGVITEAMTGSSLPQMAAMTGWATPAARDYRYPNRESYADRGGASKGEQLANQVVHSGPTSTSFHAETESRGVLSPAHSRWLMGYPSNWDHCSPFFSEWDSIQSVLGESSATTEAVWRRLAEIALADFEATEMQSSPK